MTLRTHDSAMEHVIRLTYRDRVFVFTIDRDDPLSFWRVACDGVELALPFRAIGNEGPDFFRSAADFEIQN